MDRVLEVLRGDSPDSIAVAISLVTPEVLESAPESSKHKLKTKISALLKSSGSRRAYGAVLARKALADWSVVKSHSVTWVNLLLHALDLPDEICWAPITKTLTYLFGKVHGKSDLSREVAGSKVGEFMKRLIKTLPTTHAVYAVREMLKLYPAQCRPSLNKLEPVLRQEDPSTVAYLCVSEKQSAEVWRNRFDQHVALLKEFQNLSEIDFARNLRALHEYVTVAAVIDAKIPASPLIDVVVTLLSSFRPAAVQFTCEFIRCTFPYLKGLYIEQFEPLVFALGDCLDMGIQEAVDAVGIITLLIHAIGWVPEKYNQLFTRLTKRVLHISTKEGTAMCAQGLADYVQNPSAFIAPTLNDQRREVLLGFLSAVIVYVPGIPQSLRSQIDSIILTEGSEKQIALAALYPSKFSILPLAIERLPELKGIETLVHPRFPPLNTPKHTLDQNPDEETPEQEAFEPASENNEPQPNSAPEETTFVETTPTPEPTPKELPKIPESVKPTHRPDIQTPPEKRARLDTSTHPVPQPSSLPEPELLDNEEENEDEELVIPTLNMDSD